MAEGGGGPPARGMSRSDKGSAGSGEDGKVTSGQEGLQPVAVRDDNFSGAEGWGNRAHLLRKRVPPSGPTAYAAPPRFWYFSRRKVR